MDNLFFIDCEADGRCPSMGKLTEFGAVAYPSKATFHGILHERKLPDGRSTIIDERAVYEKFEQ